MIYTSNDIAATVYRGEDAEFVGALTPAVHTLALSGSAAGSFAVAVSTLLALGLSITSAAAFTVDAVVAHPVGATYSASAALSIAAELSDTLHMRVFTFVLSPDSAASVGTTNDNSVIAEYPGTVTKVIVSAPDAYKPDGADFIVKVSFGGTEIGTSGQRARILDATTAIDGVVYGLYDTFDAPTFLEGDVVEVEVMQVGSSYAGRMVTVQVVTLEDVS